MQTNELLATIEAHSPYDNDESAHRSLMLQFVRDHPNNWWKRSLGKGHVTVSAWVIDTNTENALLLFHAKLSRWLQPGGHIDDNDVTPLHAALRECSEETGIHARPASDAGLFDIDIHRIPARADELAHWHFDVRYLLRTDKSENIKISTESQGFHWVPIERLTLPQTEPGLRRMALKTIFNWN